MLHLRSLPAGLTVEAALVLPVFLAAMCILMFPLRVLEASEAAQMEMEKALEIVAVSEGVRRSMQAGSGQPGGEPAADPSLSSEEEVKDVSDLQPSSLFGAFDLAVTGKTIAAAFDPEVFYAEKLPVFKFPTAEDPLAQVTVTGLVRFPFMEIMTGSSRFGSIAWKLKCPVTLVSSRRAWVGRKGGFGRSFAETEETGESGTEGEDKTVYVARNSTRSGRYHVRADCHYLSNDLTRVSRTRVEEMRNKSGGKYHPCPSCHPENCEAVYLFQSGDAYHSGPSCKAIGAYVTEMTETEAKGKGLTPCSYCGRNH